MNKTKGVDHTPLSHTELTRKQTDKSAWEWTVKHTKVGWNTKPRVIPIPDPVIPL